MKFKVFLLFAIIVSPYIQFLITGNSFILPEKEKLGVIHCVINEYDMSEICFLITKKG